MSASIIGRRVKVIGNHDLKDHIGVCSDYEEKNETTDTSTFRVLFGLNSIRIIEGWHLTTIRENI